METVNFIVGYFAGKVAPLIILSKKKMHRLNFKICSYNGNISWGGASVYLAHSCGVARNVTGFRLPLTDEAG